MTSETDSIISAATDDASSIISSSSTSQLDMEAVFFRLHERLARFFASRMSRKTMLFLEFLALINAFTLLILLCWFHYWYVAKATESCFVSTLKEKLAKFDSKPDVVSLQVSGIWSRLVNEEPSTAERLTKTIPDQEGFLVAPQLFTIFLQDPVFVYSSERGFLMLDDETRKQHLVREISIKLDTEKECLEGITGPYERYLLDNFIGYDSVVLNAMGAVYGSGFLYSVHSRELLNVDHASAKVSVAAKLSAVATTLFLFFITTTLVHHTLRETQERMLKFTFDLQTYVRRRLPYRNLVLNHVVGSLVFVPVVVGMLFFLFEFFNDQLLAFMVLTMVWVCELYSVITLRTLANLRVFPRLFFLYFCSFHMYVFLFPSGFTYMALTCCVMFLQHGMVSFFIHHEIPAIMMGRINTSHPRDTSRELLPEEVQAGGASLAVRALVGVRDRVPPTILAVAHPNLETSQQQQQQRQVQGHQVGGVGSDTTNISVLLEIPVLNNNGHSNVVNARSARKKRTTITGTESSQAGVVSLGGDGNNSSVTGSNLSSVSVNNGTSGRGGAVVGVGHISPSLGWVDENNGTGNNNNNSNDDESSSTGWEIGGTSS
jgi:hypothetical protein